MKAVLAIGTVYLLFLAFSYLAEWFVSLGMDETTLDDEQLPEVMDGAFVMPTGRQR